VPQQSSRPDLELLVEARVDARLELLEFLVEAMSPKVTKRKRRLFTPEFKAEAVRLVRGSGKTSAGSRPAMPSR
jgi:hypothetical protein